MSWQSLVKARWVRLRQLGWKAPAVNEREVSAVSEMGSTRCDYRKHLLRLRRETYRVGLRGIKADGNQERADCRPDRRVVGGAAGTVLVLPCHVHVGVSVFCFTNEVGILYLVWGGGGGGPGRWAVGGGGYTLWG